MKRFLIAVLALAGIYAAMSYGIATSGAAFWLAVVVVALWLGPWRLIRLVLGLVMMGRALGG